jgi:hypothetical protein
MTTNYGVWVVAGLGLVGCGTGDRIATLARPGGGSSSCKCTDCPCKTQALIGETAIDEPALPPATSESGVKIEKVTTSAGALLELHISNDRLSAVETASPLRQHSGEDLVGLTLWMSTSHQELYRVVIDSVSHIDLWEGAPDPVEAYELTALRVEPPDPNGKPTFVCSGDGTFSDPLWGGLTHSAIVFTGDHLDIEHGAVTPQQPGVFNLGCSGSVPAKIHLARHTEASNHDGTFPTTLDQRQAMLKMLLADYCGTGQSFTSDNFPIRWLDNTGWPQPQLDLDPAHGEVSSIEAIWGPSGAICLDTPRETPRDKIQCVLPVCQSIVGWESRGHIISANPVLP